MLSAAAARYFDSPEKSLASPSRIALLRTLEFEPQGNPFAPGLNGNRYPCSATSARNASAAVSTATLQSSISCGGNRFGTSASEIVPSAATFPQSNADGIPS